jgi:hypothetical protein
VQLREPDSFQATKRVADDRYILEMQSGDERRDILNQVVQVISTRRLFGVAVTPTRQAQTMKAIAELRREVAINVWRVALARKK